VPKALLKGPSALEFGLVHRVFYHHARHLSLFPISLYTPRRTHTLKPEIILCSCSSGGGCCCGICRSGSLVIDNNEITSIA